MISFRETPVADATAQALLGEYFAFRADTFPVASGYRTTLPDAAQFVTPRGVFLVAADGDEVLGCGGIRALGGGRFEVKHLWIRPAHQGRGLGRALLSELEQRAIALGATEAVLDTNGSLEAAGRLYRSHGYVEIVPYNDNPNATHWFGKTLDR